MDFNNYSIDKYKSDIDLYGLRSVWEEMLGVISENKIDNPIFEIDNLGKLYEIGLEHLNKDDKKENGIYYTPKDVAYVLSNYLLDLDGSNICDVSCGTGNLIISYLSLLDREKVINLIKNGNLYLYDMDDLALYICKHLIGLIYGKEYIDNINCIVGDFLNKDIHLPDDCKVISNPPYSKFTNISSSWEITDVIKDSKELYSAFMEKIIKESKSSVLITPFSFIGSDKFYSLRLLMNNYNGFILSFDNMPSCIFNGKKHGIFNTNFSNSVRAAITVVENKKDVFGFKLSPLIRFCADEREKLLNNSVLNSFVCDNYQVVSKSNKKYVKCFSNVLPLHEEWTSKSDNKFNSLLSDSSSSYVIYMPKTCRYFVSATKKDLDRAGKITLYFKDLESFEFAYCLLNSSFSYLYWRIFDGAVTYSDGLLKSLPIFSSSLSDENKKEIHDIVSEMIIKENDYLVYKKNASVMQENVKFPDEYRHKLNRILISVLGIDFDEKELDVIHKNCIF